MVKNINTWRLKNMLLNSQKVTEEIKKNLETNDNWNKMTQNQWDVVKAVARVKFIAIQVYLKKWAKHQIYNLKNKLKNLTPKATRKKEQEKSQSE